MSAPYDDIVSEIMAELAELPGGSAGAACVEPLVRKVIEWAVKHVQGQDLLSDGADLGMVPVAQGDGTVEWASGGGGTGDMTKAEFAVNGETGVVDHAVEADQLGGMGPEEFAAASHTHAGSDIVSAVREATTAAGIDDGTYAATAEEIRAACDKPAWAAGPYRLPIAMSESVTVGEGGVIVMGQFAFNAGAYTISHVRFEACLWVSVAAAGPYARVRLYNLTDGEYVTGAVCTTTSETVSAEASGDLTIGSDAGDLKSSQKVYEVRLEIVDGVAMLDASHLGSAHLVLEV